MPKYKEQYWTSDENGASVLKTREIGDEDTGEDTGLASAAEKMSTRQVIAGEDPNTGFLDERGLDDVPTAEVRREYVPNDDTPENKSANGRGGKRGAADEPREARSVDAAPENKARIAPRERK